MTTISEFRGPYAWLSNFESVEVELDGVTYPSVEHAYQAAKFTQPAIRAKIRAAPNAAAAKRQARLWPITTPRWEEARVEVMGALLQQKFRRPDLAEKLLATGDAYLEEGNWWGDTFWGVCKGAGENRLGVLLMQTRGALGGTGVVSLEDDFDLEFGE